MWLPGISFCPITKLIHKEKLNNKVNNIQGTEPIYQQGPSNPKEQWYDNNTRQDQNQLIG